MRRDLKRLRSLTGVSKRKVQARAGTEAWEVAAKGQEPGSRDPNAPLSRPPVRPPAGSRARFGARDKSDTCASSAASRLLGLGGGLRVRATRREPVTSAAPRRSW